MMELESMYEHKEDGGTTKITLDGLRPTLIRAVDLRAKRMKMSRARLLRALLSHEFMGEEAEIVDLDRRAEGS